MAKPRLAIITDTKDQIDGIAIGLARLVTAARRAGHDVSLIGPADLPTAMSASLPFYPQYTWCLPELPALTKLLARTADLVQLATPGPMGIAGLIAARMLGLPVLAQYHTEVPEYAARMTRLPFVKRLVSPYVAWFYRQANMCLAPSRVTSERLVELGIPSAQIRRVQRGVDLALFDPARRDRGLLAQYGIAATAPVTLYVGRLSREKNLGVLRRAWQQIHGAQPRARLIVVGDGPQATALDGPGVVRTGMLHGEQLAAVFATADVFAFPSETETFGNVVVEAAASGLPVVVAARGAAQEHVVEGETGLVYGDRAAALARDVLLLFADPARRARMAIAAREHVRTYDLERAMAMTWEMYGELYHRVTREPRSHGPRVRQQASGAAAWVQSSVVS
jgi:glycosyltransferase involved in cell wall biosynthesis